MRFLFTLLCLSLAFSKVSAQDVEIKVVSKQYATVIGHLMKISPEGIGVEDFKGNYITFRPHEIVRLVIRRRGFTFFENVGGGALFGLGIGGLLSTLDKGETAGKEILAVTAALTGAGVITGTIIGILTPIFNHKLTLKVDGSPEKFRAQFEKLAPYVLKISTEHVN